MKKLIIIIGVATLVAVAAQRQSQKVEWMNEMNDLVYYETNLFAPDVGRNRTNKSQIFIYMTTVITTNKVRPFYYRFGNRHVEIGARDDGVIVWREGAK